jgi:signal transduction histidine kinase
MSLTPAIQLSDFFVAATSASAGSPNLPDAFYLPFLLIGLGLLAGVRTTKRTPVKKGEAPGKKKGAPAGQSARANLQRSERIQDSIAMNFPEGMVLALDRKMKFRFIGGKEVSELKKSKKHWMGKVINENFHPSININAIGQLKRSFDNEAVEYEVMTNNKSYLVRSIPITGSARKPDEILVIIRNITEMIRLESNLKKALQKEKEFNILRSRFVTLASHEFRTPLSTILTSVFLLENYSGDDYEQEKLSYIDKIKRAVHNLTDLLNNFLSVGKLEEGKLKVDLTDVELKPFLEGILQEVMSIRKVRQDIVFKYESEYDRIQTDKQLLKNIVMNLLTNAIKYSPTGEEIHLDTELRDDLMKIRVTDQGTGIPESEQGQIFKRFFRGQNASNIEGTGLGLNLVKKYVRLLKGSIEFTSQVSKGSTFIVRIPTTKALKNNGDD